MRIFSFFIFCCFMFLLSYTSVTLADPASEDKTCPAYIQVLPIISENNANVGNIAWVPQAIADALPLSVRPTNVRVVTQDIIKKATQDLAQQQANGGGNDASLKNLARGDFIVTVQWAKILDVKHILTLKLKSKNNDEIAMRSMDVQDLSAQLNNVDAFVRKSARDFGVMLANRFYCIKINPKEADLSEGDKKQFHVTIENLKGEPISGETVTFSVDSTQIGTAIPIQQSLANGKTDTTYKQIKSEKNKLKAAVKPKQFLSEDSYVIAKIEPGLITLVLKTDETAEAHESDGHAKARISRLVEIPLAIDRKTKQVSGHGVSSREPWINSMKASAAGGKDWGHSAPMVHEDVDVTGTLTENDTVLKLKVKIKPTEQAVPASITAKVEGITVHFRGMARTEPEEIINIEMPFQIGAVKEKQIHQTYPGVVLYGQHVFKLVPYRAR